jgi:RNA-directed DNA polymerase
MSGRRQKNRPEQEVLAFPAESRSDAPKAAAEGIETLMAKRKSESLAGTERLMEEVCELENCKQALQRVKANKGSPGVDGMSVDELPEYLKQHGLKIGEQLRNGSYQPRPVRRVESITHFITRRLKLKVNQTKSAVARPGQRKFLGFSFTSEREPRRRIAPKAIARFQERIRDQTQRTRGISLTQRVKDLTTYLRGWLGYFGDCQTPSVLQRLETWLRRRLRSAVWKQWKQGRTRFRELRKRGVGKDLAAQTAGSPHGPWRITNSPALAIALPNAYFAQLGLPPLVVRSA